MTEFSGAADNSSDFDGNTFLLQWENNECVYISGLEIFQFNTDDKIIDYISLMGNIMLPYAIILGEKFTKFLCNRYKIIGNDKVEEGTLLNRTDSSSDPYDYHVQKCVKDALKILEHTQIHTFWPGVREDIEDEDEDDDLVEENEKNEDLIETIYTNVNNEVVKCFNQKCVICLERDSACAFRQGGHQFICEQSYQNKGDIDMLKCVVCRA